MKEAVTDMVSAVDGIYCKYTTLSWRLQVPIYICMCTDQLGVHMGRHFYLGFRSYK